MNAPQESPLSSGDCADELFAHGVLGVVHEQGAGSRDARVRKVMEAIELPARLAREHRRHQRRRRLLGAASMIVCVSAAIVFLVSPVTTPSYASIEDSITVMRGPGERRYQISAEFAPRAQEMNGPHGTIDTAYPGKMLLQVRRPDGGEVVCGRDEQGEWAITDVGGVDREHPRRAWPGWAISEGELMSADSVDQWLEAATQGYTLSKPDRAPLPGASARECDHIVGVRKPVAGPDERPNRGPNQGPNPGPNPGPNLRLRSADRIEVWIDPATKVVERMELAWKPRPALDGGPRMPGAPGDRPGRPIHDDRLPQDERRDDIDRAGPGGDGSGEAPPDHAGGPPDADREPLPDHRPGRPDMADDGDQAGDHPDDRPLRDDLPRGPRPFPPPFPGPRDLRGGPPQGRVPDGPPGLPGAGHEGPGRRPPLRRLIIERQDAAAFPADWFKPESHLATNRGDAPATPPR